MKTQRLVKMIGTLVVTLMVGGCAERPLAPGVGVPKGGTQVGATYKQIERLGRPAINEGLVITNDFLNAFNSIGPSLDLSSAASPVVAEAGAVLTAVFNYGSANGLAPAPVGNVVAGFLPDVLRIDTRVNVPVSNWAYNADAAVVSGTSAPMLTAGRKLEDDVIDITLSYLLNGNPFCGPSTPCDVPDGVSYAGGTTCATAGQGTNPSAPGHKCLEGQTVRNGNAVFPFLAKAN